MATFYFIVNLASIAKSGLDPFPIDPFPMDHDSNSSGHTKSKDLTPCRDPKKLGSNFSLL